MSVTEVFALLAFLASVPLFVVGLAKFRELPADASPSGELVMWMVAPLVIALSSAFVVRQQEVARDPARFEAPAEHDHEDKPTETAAHDTTGNEDHSQTEAVAQDKAETKEEPTEDAGDAQPTVAEEPPAEPAGAAEQTAAKPDGKALYAANCAACHKDNGEGIPGAFPPLAGSEWTNGPAQEQIKVVLNGLSGPIKVKGVSYNGVMAPFKHLSDEDIAAIVTHERTSWGNTGGAVTPAEVKKLR